MRFGILLLAAWATITLLGAIKSHADPKKVEKLRSFYREHNLDFFGELIADQNDILADERKLAKLELLADDARTKALAQLEKLLANAKGGMQAELLIRKASLFSDRARTATYFQNNPLKASKLKAPQYYLEQSIKTFIQVERDHGNNPKMDIVTFSIAYNYGELKRVDDAFRYYNKLVQKYPNSDLVGDARLSMAEILFDKRNFKDSLFQLKEIVKAEHPRLKNFALYKMAWTYYNMGDLASGMHSLEKVIDGVNQAQGVQRARLELRKEALNDLVLFFAENTEYNSSQASEYFERIAKTPSTIASEFAAARTKRLQSYEEKKLPIPDEDTDAFQLAESQELLFRLTQVYRDQGKHQNAMTVAELILSRIPRHPKAVALYRLRAESAEKLRRRDLVIIELERLAKVIESDLPPVKAYDDGLPQDSIEKMMDFFSSFALTGKNDRTPKIKLAEQPQQVDWNNPKRAEDYYHRNLAQLALSTFKDFSNFFHGEWLKTNSKETALHASTVYDLAIKSLLTPWRGHLIKDCLELRHRRAQLRYALKQWSNAAEDYAWLALRTKADDERETILRGEIAALEAWLKETPVKAGSHQPVHERLINAYDRFLAFKLSDLKIKQTVASILASSARLISELGDQEQGLRRMAFYSRFFHTEKDAIALTRDVLVSLEKAGRWEDLRNFSEILLDESNYKTSAVAKDLSQAQEFAHLKLLENLEKTQDWKQAAKEFSNFAQKHQDSPFASQALMKAANAALQLNNAELSVKNLEAATVAQDEAVRLQAWLGLEPFYRKAFMWKKLAALYRNVLKLKSDAKTRTAAQTNLASIEQLNAATFLATGTKLLSHDPDLNKLQTLLTNYEATTKEFMSLRFVKSNNNPASNFKRKADMHAKLSSGADKLVDSTPKSLRGGAAIWANIMKAELLFEFAETLETASLPTALKAASDADRKSYTETILGQAKELRQKAKQFVDESALNISKIDFPIPLEKRLNALLDKTENKSARISRPLFSKIWNDRARIKVSESKNFDDQVTTQAIRALEKTDKNEFQTDLLKLARIYAENGEFGYAHAIASGLVAEAKADVAGPAQRMLVALELERTPRTIHGLIEADNVDSNLRWDLARWISSLGVAAKKHPDAYSESELAWFDKAVNALLRANQGD